MKETEFLGSEAGFFRSVLDASPEPTVVFECGPDDHLVLYINPAFERLTGCTLAGTARCARHLLFGHDADHSAAKLLRKAIYEGEETRLRFRSHCANDMEFWRELHIARLGTVSGNRRQYVGILRDISEEKASRDQLQHRALHDALTGVPNRYLFQDRLEHAIAHARSRDGTFALVQVDLDQFKQINDTLGHEAGDEVLVHVAAQLTHALRGADTVARMGGDEFCLILESVEDDHALAGVLERLIDMVERPVCVQGTPISVSCSLGVSQYPCDGIDAASLLRKADRAMYGEKARNRPRSRMLVDSLIRDASARAMCEPA